MKPLILILTAVTIASCDSIFNATVFPNQCRNCSVVDGLTGEVYREFEGCGGANTKLEEEAKIYAFDCVKRHNNCNIDVVCRTWKQDPEK